MSRNCIVLILLLAGSGAQPAGKEVPPAPGEAVRTETVPAPVATREPEKSAPAKAAAPAAKPAAPAKAAPAPKPAAPAPVAARPIPPPLDLKTLEQRLKDTSAVGVLTKLSLKNQVDDLVARFRAFHGGQRPPTLGDLRPSFDLLLMKVLSLLQDKDAALAKDIDASRNAIWEVLTDRDKLAKFT